MSLQSQEQFRSHVTHLIVTQSVKELVSDMRTAIQATHVILDTAITPGISLIPSSLVILKEPIPGYKNILLTANSNMNFGMNKEVNRIEREIPKPEPKRPEPKPTISVPKPKPIIPEITESHDKVNEVENKINPTVIFISSIISGILFSVYK